MDKKKRRRGKEEEKKEEGKRKGKKKKKKGQFRHFTTSTQHVKPFCQTFSKTASAPSEKSLHRRSRSRSPANQTLSIENY
jgi:hypothetical protein